MPDDKEIARLFVGAIQSQDPPHPVLVKWAHLYGFEPQGTEILEPLMYPEDKETKNA